MTPHPTCNPFYPQKERDFKIAFTGSPYFLFGPKKERAVREMRTALKSNLADMLQIAPCHPLGEASGQEGCRSRQLDTTVPVGRPAPLHVRSVEIGYRCFADLEHARLNKFQKGGDALKPLFLLEADEEHVTRLQITGKLEHLSLRDGESERDPLMDMGIHSRTPFGFVPGD